MAALLAPATGGLSFAVAVGVSFAVDYFASNAAQNAGKHGGTIVYQIKYEDRSQ